MARTTRPLTERNTEDVAQVLTAKVKSERTTTRDKGKGRAEEQSDNEPERDGDDANGEDDGEQGGSPKGRKRARANTDGDARPADEEKYAPRALVETLPRDVDGFIPGSIVRIQLKNFVTYDFTEFRLGPYLNMIIGPNGTGKSTIACAICIGLNWPAATLGRATEVNSFVKQGTKDGYIEIELKGPKGKNLVIRRLLKADHKTSTFTLNGINATGKEISNQMAALNVQVGNLCTFLPQDKVSGFAGMSPQQLLKETQRAAGDTNLSDWHQTLIDEGAELKKTQEAIQSEHDQLKQMKDRNEAIERDVQRYKERKKIEEEIQLLTVLIPVQKYIEMRERYFALKEQKHQLFMKVKALNAKNEPAHNFKKKLEKDAAKLEDERNKLKKAIQDKMKKINAKATSIEKLEGDTEDLHQRIELLNKEEKARASKMSNAKATIEKLRAELSKDVKIESDTEINNQIIILRQERQSIIDRKTALKVSISSNADRTAGLQRLAEGKRNELGRLDDVDVQKLYNLSRYNNDTAETVKWLRRNRDKFRMEVFEPPYLTVNMTNRNFAAQVESCFSRNNLLTFVAQCKEDYDMFNRTVNDTTEVCGRKIRVTAWFRPQQPQMYQEPPMSREEMAQLGFSGYLIDYISYPEGMLWFLQCDLNLHRIAVGPQNVDVGRAMTAVTRPNVNPANFINGSSFNQVSRSRYGKKLAQNMTRGVGPAKTFIASAVDPEIKGMLDRELKEALQQLEMSKEESDELRTKWQELEAEDSGFSERANDLKRRKDAIQALVKQRMNYQTQLVRHEKTLKDLENAPSAEQEKANIKKKLFNVAKDSLTQLKDYSNLTKAVFKDQKVAARIGLEYLQANSNLAALRTLLTEKDAKYERALAAFNAVNKAFIDAKQESKDALEESRRVLGDAEQEIQERHEEITAKRNQYNKELKAAEANGSTPPPTEGIELRSSDELEAEIESQRALLALSMSTNPGVMEEYEKRKRDIEVLERTLETKQNAANRIEKNIKKARDNWEPALRRLVDAIGKKFSAAFDSIGCAGEIRVSTHEDYDKWAIDILVKFRDEEKLQLLTGQRQSGGERSLTTILYLMSLTEQARAPFSLVDEINQGMDQRAERLVHNNMVRVTCQDDAGQYFLITPKLLPDLKYHPRMKVLCVNNGEWLPEETGLGNMMNMIEGFVARK